MIMMPKRLVVALAAGMLAVGTARGGSVKVDFNPKADFESYKTWGWAPERDQEQHGVLAGETVRQRLEAALTHRLRIAGLNPADPGQKPDVLVRYQGDIGTGKTVSTSAGSIANMSDPGYATLQFAEQTVTLMVDLLDASTNTLAWRLYIDQEFGGPNDPPNKLAKAVDKGFAQYPPSAKARARKARELEKR